MKAVAPPGVEQTLAADELREPRSHLRRPLLSGWSGSRLRPEAKRYDASDAPKTASAADASGI